MHGDDARKLQQRLAGANAFKENYKPGSVDGVFGEQTAGACYRAKFWCGYPPKELIRSYGDKLDKLLRSGELPPAYKSRRTARKKAMAVRPKRLRALEVAIQQLGKKEDPPGSNQVSFSRWYGITGPWCAMFATWCYTQAGSAAFVKGERYAYVPYMLAAARLGGRGLVLTTDPLPGDLVIFDWENNGVPDHVGLFERHTMGGGFKTVEGNTAVGNDSNGGEVMRRDRQTGPGIHFVHVAT